MTKDTGRNEKPEPAWRWLAGAAALLLAGALGYVVVSKESANLPSAGSGTEALWDRPIVVGEEVEFAASGEPLVVVYFELAQADVPRDAAQALESVLRAAEIDATTKVLLSGYHDASGDAAKNADLARDRAKAVRAALQARGLPPERVLLNRPEATTGSDSDREARRVEIRIVKSQ